MNDKQLVAIQAAHQVKDGMTVGLGTGSTANYFIQELARRHQEEGLRITAAASSVVSAIKAQELGLPLVAIEHLGKLDLYVDGADEVTTRMTLLKGRGYDLVREKLLARGSDQFIVLIDKSKLVGRIGEKFPIPVEVMPFAWQLVKSRLQALGAHAELRQNAAKDGWAITSHGSLVLDLTFDSHTDDETLNQQLNDIPGVVEHGIFHDIATAIFVADNGKVEEIWKN
ncbi:ribose-5-phosphate isomerase [Methylobacillus rhizosphaerae]|uniref:Ribose-5-phosphate isomerase A n=1 Tax=Methylobacillus rhizosphaerae TaxID=551994 RepID=A0A238YVS9_9PROT|nr:ribose-5-phosphate isomerase RpiA [Methylobacillus rhizosphaerae]SNR74683.1 ribose-5-phosphate isomerase [Methylobacillus rhizosphaerae]